ncbi:hypothetical protein ACFVT5_15245 [Streptomyces sp. NPDC058001]|uniref:hypothetical protein n=1 Tax=Streptomyces sp. NPDC058001 TaxID=3346300 RepID=UPI0036EC1A3F
MSLLGPLDEELNHQTSSPFRVPGTTDHRFYDRHWFEAVHPSGEVMLLSGLGIYKNMGVADGFLVAQRDRRQTNVRVSRPLGNDLRPVVGPLQVEILEPYERIRLTLAPGEYSLRAELMWHSTFPPYLEAPHHTFRDGRVIQDTSRYDQTGRWEGWIELDGTRFESDDWWGVRDHSWGVRPDVGGFEPKNGHRREPMLWLWTFATAGDVSVHFQLRESGAGAVRHFDGEVQYAPGSGREPVRIDRVDHDIVFIEGTRDWTTLRYDLFLSDGRKMVLEAEAVQSAWAYRGTGYENGYDDSRGVGVPRGELVETDHVDLSVPGRVTREGEPWFPGHREQPARVRIDGVPGTGHLPVMSSGRVERYGLGR